MHIEIVPFRDTHLEEAADLLALRHQGDHALEPALPLRFKQATAVRAAVEATWRKPDASGVVALYAGRMIGYLIGVRYSVSWWWTIRTSLPMA
jgi:hypothetical protein